MRRLLLSLALLFLAAAVAQVAPRRAAAEDVTPAINSVTVTRELVDTFSSRWCHVVHIYGCNFTTIVEVSIDGASGPAEGGAAWEITRETMGTTGQVVIHVKLPPEDEAEHLLEGRSIKEQRSHTITVTNKTPDTQGELQTGGSANGSARW